VNANSAHTFAFWLELVDKWLDVFLASELHSMFATLWPTTHSNTHQDAHYILVLKFKDFSGTFKEPEVAFLRTNSRRKFTAICNTYFCDYGTVLVDKNKTWQLLANLVPGKHLFNRAADVAQLDLVNSRTFKDLWNEIQGLSSTCPVFKYFRGLEFKKKKFKYSQVLSRMRGNPDSYNILAQGGTKARGSVLLCDKHWASCSHPHGSVFKQYLVPT